MPSYCLLESEWKTQQKKAVQLWSKRTGASMTMKKAMKKGTVSECFSDFLWQLLLNISCLHDHRIETAHGQLGMSTVISSHLAKSLQAHHNRGICANKGTWRKVYDAGECLHWSSSAGVSLSKGPCPLRNKCQTLSLQHISFITPWSNFLTMHFCEFYSS